MKYQFSAVVECTCSNWPQLPSSRPLLYSRALFRTRWMQNIVGQVWASCTHINYGGLVWKSCWVWARSNRQANESTTIFS